MLVGGAQPLGCAPALARRGARGRRRARPAAAGTPGPRPRRTANGSSSRGVGARVEQQPHVLRALVVERVGEHDRLDRRAVLEQRAQALGARRLGRVVDGLAVVGVRARLEQHARELGVVDDAGGAVERGHLAVLVGERDVRVGAAVEQLARRATATRRRSGRRRAAAPSRAGRRARSRRRPSRRRARAAPTGRSRSPVARPAAPRRATRRPDGGGADELLGRPRSQRTTMPPCARSRSPARAAPTSSSSRTSPSPSPATTTARRGRGDRRQLPRRLRARGPRRDVRASAKVPLIVGAEGAGTVLQGAGEFAAGDRVAWAAAPGSYAERVAVPAGQGRRGPGRRRRPSRPPPRSCRA